MKHKAIFFDRDNTLIKDKGYVHKIEDLILKPGIIEALKELNKHYKLFIITNQSGIGQGKYTEAQFHAFQDHFLKILSENDINIENTFYCPHTPEDNCMCRKPATTFIKKAEKDYKLNLKDSYVIGDKDSDIEMGKKAGCKVINAKKANAEEMLALVKAGKSLE